jgi:septal ring-binding cell division protein DamX
LDAVLDSIDRINLNKKFIEGFTIQVYSGMKREDALNVKKQLLTTLPEFESELQYSQPNYRVKMGKYYSRLEAEKDYQLVKRFFKAAILVPDKIAVN